MPNTQTPMDLSSLHDIHVPDPIGWWPLAPGWYLLFLFFILTGVIIAYVSRRYYLMNRAKRDALRTLITYQTQYKHDPNGQRFAALLSELLKRCALAYYPRTRVAGLQGEAWLAFLNSTGKGVNFNPVRMALLELPWQHSISQMTDDETMTQALKALFDTTRQWIKKQGKPCSN